MYLSISVWWGLISQMVSQISPIYVRGAFVLNSHLVWVLSEWSSEGQPHPNDHS